MMHQLLKWQILLGAPLLGAVSAYAQDVNLERGEALYRNHCTECHESIVHIRDKPSARSIQQLRQQVIRWAAEINQEWGREEIGDVTAYLNANYYRFPDR